MTNVNPAEDQEKNLPPLVAEGPQRAHAPSSGVEEEDGLFTRLLRAVSPGVKRKGEETLREVLEGVIETLDEDAPTTVAPHERAILGNVLRLRNLSVADVMIPRADIAAIEIETHQEDLLTFVAEKQFSRYPVYRETLDDIAGTVHIKDVLAAMAAGAPFSLRALVREPLIVSPALPIMDLLLQMRHSGKHIVLVVDEYGGIDGLATIEDIVQAIIGEVGDERDPDAPPDIIVKPDGSLIVDARLPIEDFERRYGNIFSNEEDACDTLGGLVFALAGHVPGRGEVVAHGSGAVFEVLEADPRRVRRLRIRNLPSSPEGQKA